ncbi:MAG: helix-turn-helix transcriptional regulator [Clostridia bacterium]
MTQEDLLNRLYNLRIKKKLSAKELSLRLGKHYTYIGKVESKAFMLPINTMFEILDICDMTCEEFFYGNTSSYSHDMEAIKQLKNLTIQQKQGLIDFLEAK